MFKQWKGKWNITSNLQFITIIIVFSVTGSAALVVRKFVFHVIGIQPDTSLFIKIPLYIIVLIPSYQILLLIIGAIFGQFSFFFAFQKKTLLALKWRNRKKNGKN
jgi:ferrochelatase